MNEWYNPNLKKIEIYYVQHKIVKKYLHEAGALFSSIKKYNDAHMFFMGQFSIDELLFISIGRDGLSGWGMFYSVVPSCIFEISRHSIRLAGKLISMPRTEFLPNIANLYPSMNSLTLPRKVSPSFGRSAFDSLAIYTEWVMWFSVSKKALSSTTCSVKAIPPKARNVVSFFSLFVLLLNSLLRLGTWITPIWHLFIEIRLALRSHHFLSRSSKASRS